MPLSFNLIYENGGGHIIRLNSKNKATNIPKINDMILHIFFLMGVLICTFFCAVCTIVCANDGAICSGRNADHHNLTLMSQFAMSSL